MTNYRENHARWVKANKEAHELHEIVKSQQEVILDKVKKSLDPYVKDCMGYFRSDGEEVIIFLRFDDDTDSTSFVFCEGQWLWFKQEHDFYPSTVVRGKSDPFDTAAVEKVLLEASQEWGIVFKKNEHHFAELPPWDGCHNPSQLVMHHPGSSVLGSGDIVRMGSDIYSPWAVLETPKGVWVYYGNHTTYSHRIAPGGSVQEFLDYICDPWRRSCEGLTEDLRNRLEDLV